MRKLLLCVLLASFIRVNSRLIRVECPSYCECDIISNLKRATCVNRTIAVIHLDLPPQTEILDISHNQISQLNDHVFSKNGLTKLELLNISHNKLSEINVFAFDGLNELKSLDLSFNLMQYVLSYWFSSLKRLESLHLEGNRFGDLSKLPASAFNSKTLKTLNLKNSFITYLPKDLFRVPNLEYLDLSNNHMISLNQKIFAPMRNLKFLNVTNNPFLCTKGMDAVRKLAERRKIDYKDPCPKKIKKLEEMIVESTTSKTDEKSYWIIEDEAENQKNIDLNKTELCESFDKEKNALINISELPYVLLIFTVLLYGILIGFICGCGVKSCKMRHHVKKYKTKNTVRLRRFNVHNDETHQLTSNADMLGNSTPVFARK